MKSAIIMGGALAILVGLAAGQLAAQQPETVAAPTGGSLSPASSGSRAGSPAALGDPQPGPAAASSADGAQPSPTGTASEDPVIGEVVADEDDFSGRPLRRLRNWLGCCDCCGCCGTGLDVIAGVVLMHRSRAPEAPLAFDSLNQAQERLDAHDLEPGWRAGARVDGIWTFGEQYAIEAVYLGVQDWHTAPSLIRSDTDPLLVPTLSPTTFFEQLTARYVCDLNSGEVNLREKCCGECKYLTFLTGFRYFGLRDTLTLSGEATNIGTADASAQALNNLYGFQIGADLNIPHIAEHTSLEGFLKAGIYSDEVKLAQTTSGTGAFAGNTSFNTSHNQVACAAEVVARLSYEVGCHCELFGGYDAVWLDGVALAPLHLPPVNTIHASRTAFFDGGMLGVEAHW
jgi:hypothetical protein